MSKQKYITTITSEMRDAAAELARFLRQKPDTPLDKDKVELVARGLDRINRRLAIVEGGLRQDGAMEFGGVAASLHHFYSVAGRRAHTRQSNG